MRRPHIRHHRILKLTDLGFHRIPPIKKHHIIAAIRNQLVHLLRLQMHAPTNNTMLIHLQLLRRPKRHNLIPNLHRQLRKIIGTTSRPLKLRILKPRILPKLPHIPLTILHVTPQSAIDTMLRNQNPARKTKQLTQVTLPQPHRLRIRNRGELIKQENLAKAHAFPA